MRGAKKPPETWQPANNTIAKSDQTIAALEESTDNIGCHFHGPLVDVDVDVKGAHLPMVVAALDLYLPSCPHIWGREKRPRTHRAYQLEADFKPSSYPVLSRMKNIEEANIEVRGGPVSAGRYTVMPGSTGPDGDRYLWANTDLAASTPAVVSADRLLSGIRMACAAALVAKYWTEGARQEMCMALSGFLHRVCDITKSVEDGFSVTKESAANLLGAVLTLAGDTAEKPDRHKAFEHTWRKAEGSAAVTGANRLGELAGDPDLPKKLYALLSDTPEMDEIDSFVQRFAIWQGPAVVVDRDQIRLGGDAPLMTKSRFTQSYGHLFVEMGGKRRLLPDMLFSMSAAVRVQGLTFEPGESELVDTPFGSKLNTWSGFNLEPWPDRVPGRDVKIMLDYIKDVVCKGRATYYEWVLAWMADLFQNPGNKPGTALVLVGKPGAGKTFLGEHILGPIIGHQHYVQANSIQHVIGNFNAPYSRKILIQCDEALNAQQRAAAARLNALITDSQQRVEPKGVDSYQLPMHARFFFTSNEADDAIYLGHGYDDRRYTVLEVSDKHVDTPENSEWEDYWKPRIEWASKEINLRKFYRYLLDHEYDRNKIQRPLRSSAKNRMQQASWDSIDGWLARMISTGHPLQLDSHGYWHDAPLRRGNEYIQEVDRTSWPDMISFSALEHDFLDYLRRFNVKAPALNAAQISRALHERGLRDPAKCKASQVSSKVIDRSNNEKKVRVKIQTWIPKHELVEYLRTRHGFKLGDAAVEAETEPDPEPDLSPNPEFEDF